MAKIETFDMTLVFEHGKYDLKSCTKFPTRDMVEDNAGVLSGLAFGLGELKKIVIDKIEWKEDDCHESE